jgi:hypothetical protein
MRPSSECCGERAQRGGSKRYQASAGQSLLRLRRQKPKPRSQRTPWLEVALAALPAALHALVLMGRLHPDEVFQSLEIALHRTYGFGIVPWEWFAPPQVPADRPWGIRNWAVPLVFSTFLKMGDAFGITSPMARRVLLEVPQFALHVAMLGAVWRLTFRRVGVKGARAAMWLVALYGRLAPLPSRANPAPL